MPDPAAGDHEAALGIAGRRRGRVLQAQRRDRARAVARVGDGDGLLLTGRENLTSKVEDERRGARGPQGGSGLVEGPALAPGALVDSGSGIETGDSKRTFFEGEEARARRVARPAQLRGVRNAAARAQCPRRNERTHRRVESSRSRSFPFKDSLQQSEKRRWCLVRLARCRGVEPRKGSVVPPGREEPLDRLDRADGCLARRESGVARRRGHREGESGPHDGKVASESGDRHMRLSLSRNVNEQGLPVKQCRCFIRRSRASPGGRREGCRGRGAVRIQEGRPRPRARRPRQRRA